GLRPSRAKPAPPSLCIDAAAAVYKNAMRVTLLYFAAARERTGKGSEVVELPDGATAADAREAACAAHPALRAVADKLRLAVDQEFAAADRKLREGSEVALIPPVSGGAGPHRISPPPPHIARRRSTPAAWPSRSSRKTLPSGSGNTTRTGRPGWDWVADGGTRTDT